MGLDTAAPDWPDRVAARAHSPYPAGNTVAAAPEPDHLHFDRHNRTWLVHFHEGGLRPFDGGLAGPQDLERREA